MAVEGTAVAFEGRTYAVDEDGAAAGAAVLPDGRTLLLWRGGAGRLIGTGVARDHVGPCGVARLVPHAREKERETMSDQTNTTAGAAPQRRATSPGRAAPSTAQAEAAPAPQGAAGQAAPPAGAIVPAGPAPGGVQAGDAARGQTPDGLLGTSDPEARNTKAQAGAILNPPLLFAVTHTVENTDQGQVTKFHPVRGIILDRFKRPKVMEGKPLPGQDPKDARDKYVYFIVTTCDGCLATNSDKRVFPVPRGTVLWLNEGPDLRPLANHMVRIDPTTRQCVGPVPEVLCTPLGKFAWIKKSTGESFQVWRWELKGPNGAPGGLRLFTTPAQLAAIASVAGALPALPQDPKDIEAADAAAGGSEEDIPF